jgi:hypothetical protein
MIGLDRQSRDARDAMPTAAPYLYVYVNADGTARELHANERQYLETQFRPGDGAAPYIKGSYAERNGWGDLNGYLERSRLPHGIEIRDAPTEDPQRSLGTKEQQIAWFRSKGMEVTENSDGSFTVRGHQHHRNLS